MSNLSVLTVMALLATLSGCGKSADTVAATAPDSTVTETSIDGTPTIVEDETLPPSVADNDPAMDSIEETRPPAKDKDRKK